MKKGFTHDNADNKSVEWYTPPWIFEELGLVFDLDPCAPLFGVPWIPAKKYYSIDDLVWLNPPYGKFTGAWLEKMHNHRNGIAFFFAY